MTQTLQPSGTPTLRQELLAQEFYNQVKVLFITRVSQNKQRVRSAELWTVAKDIEETVMRGTGEGLQGLVKNAISITNSRGVSISSERNELLSGSLGVDTYTEDADVFTRVLDAVVSTVVRDTSFFISNHAYADIAAGESAEFNGTVSTQKLAEFAISPAPSAAYVLGLS